MSTATAKSNGSQVPVIPMPSGAEMDIPISRIVADDKFNSRVFLPKEAIEEMAGSLKREGQLSPVRVTPRKDGKFDLTFGFRRFYAAKDVLGWTTIKASVDTDPAITHRARMVQNLVENEQRRDLTTYERAKRYHEMLTEKVGEGEKVLSQNTLATMTGMSPSYISRLVSGIEKLHPKVIDRWKFDCLKEVETKGQHTSLINITSLKELIKYDHDLQLRWLDEAINGPAKDAADDEDEDPNDEDPNKPDTKPRASLAQVKAALKAATAARKESENAAEQAFRDGAMAALRFAIRPRRIEGILSMADGKVKAMHGAKEEADDKTAKKAAKKD